MSELEVAQVEKVRFVIARSDLRAGRRTVCEGSWVRCDDELVREHPEHFTDVCVPHVFHFALRRYAADDGRFLEVVTNRLAGDAPAANTSAWADFWSRRLRDEGREVWDMTIEEVGEHEFVVRCSIDAQAPARMERAQPAPSEPPVINVTIPPIEIPPAQVTVNIQDEPLAADVRFRRDSNGAVTGATITENTEENDV